MEQLTKKSKEELLIEIECKLLTHRNKIKEKAQTTNDANYIDLYNEITEIYYELFDIVYNNEILE